MRKLQREGQSAWQGLYRWGVVRHDGADTAFGFKKTDDQGTCVIEVSNEGQGPYQPLGSEFDISSCL